MADPTWQDLPQQDQSAHWTAKPDAICASGGNRAPFPSHRPQSSFQSDARGQVRSPTAGHLQTPYRLRGTAHRGYLQAVAKRLRRDQTEAPHQVADKILIHRHAPEWHVHDGQNHPRKQALPVRHACATKGGSHASFPFQFQPVLLYRQAVQVAWPPPIQGHRPFQHGQATGANLVLHADDDQAKASQIPWRPHAEQPVPPDQRTVKAGQEFPERNDRPNHPRQPTF